MSSATPAPITFPNSLANLGIVKPGPRSYLAVRAAREKIRNYEAVQQHDPCFAG